MTTTTQPERLLTVAEAAEAVNFGRDVILRWLDEGLPFVAGAANAAGRRRGRKDYRISPTDLAEWVRNQRVMRQPAAPAAPQAPAAKAPGAGAGKGLSAWRAAKKGAKG